MKLSLACSSLCLLLLATPSVAQSPFDLHEVAWTLTPEASGDAVQLEMLLAPLHDRERLVLRMPLWRPGSYRYFNYQNALSNLKATDSRGKPCQIQALDPRTWEVDVRGVSALTVSYQISVTNEAKGEGAPAFYLRGPGTFLYTEDSLELPHSLQVNLPRRWKFASGHRPAAGGKNFFRSPNYDVFADCPMALGELEIHEFESHGTPFEVVFLGDVPSEKQLPRSDWLATVSAICEASRAVAGEYPFERYVFLYVFNGIGGYSGLEHLNSTTIIYSARWAKTGKIDGLESVTAHEFFHLWNVKRIRPQQLGPFDYSRDVRTRDLWWHEGITSYYADIILQRAGLRGDGWFLDAQARNFRGQYSSSGYGNLSPERSSWTVWDPNPRTSISYYDSGQSLGLFLDVLIRHHTDNRRSLDDVVRFLTRWVDYPNVGYRPGDLEKAIYSVTGWDCHAFFDRHIRSPQPYPWQEVMPLGGVKLRMAEPGSPYLGFGVDEKMVTTVSEKSPAAESGMQTGDVLLALAGTRVSNFEDVLEIMSSLEVNAEIEYRIKRNGSSRTLRGRVAERNRFVFRLEIAPDAKPKQAAILQGILQGTPAGI